MEDKSWLALVGMILLVVLECVAMLKGINGMLLSGVIAIIAGLAGYNAKPLVEKLKGLKK